MSAVLNGKIIFEAKPAGWSHTRGYKDGLRQRRRGDSVPQRHRYCLSCTSVGVPAALQRRYDPGRIRGLIYCSSVSGPVPGLGSRSDEMGVAVRIVSYSVTTTTPGAGSSITSMIVSSTGTSTTCLGAFLGAFLAAIFDGRCFLAMGFAAPLTARRTLDFAFFGVVRFVAFLRAGLALALPRFELFLRVATRFFALAMIVPCEICRRQADLESSQLC